MKKSIKQLKENNKIKPIDKKSQKKIKGGSQDVLIGNLEIE